MTLQFCNTEWSTAQILPHPGCEGLTVIFIFSVIYGFPFCFSLFFCSQSKRCIILYFPPWWNSEWLRCKNPFVHFLLSGLKTVCLCLWGGLFPFFFNQQKELWHTDCFSHTNTNRNGFRHMERREKCWLGLTSRCALDSWDQCVLFLLLLFLGFD